MAAYNFTPPPLPAGTQEEKLRAVYGYLYRMNESMNVALNNLTADNFSAQEGEAIAKVKENGGSGESAAQRDRYDALRSLVVKTASAVRAEMDVLEGRLEGRYLAISDFGEYRQDMEAQMRATAEGVVQEYGFESQLHDLSGEAGAFTDYMVTTSQYIKTGLLFFDGATPRYGVAVGENLTTAVVDGEEVLSRANLCATFTSDKLSFWMGGAEVAYVSNNKLYIANAEITGQLVMGSWRVSRENGFMIQWIGG